MTSTHADCGICDGSGVLAITDIPASRVAVCPAWPVDQDEPLAYWEAIDGLGYDRIPSTMQQRIWSNVMQEIEQEPQISTRTKVVVIAGLTIGSWGLVALVACLVMLVVGLFYPFPVLP